MPRRADGTAQDVSLLVDFLPPTLFPLGEHTVARWAVAGFSLGGHTAWLAAARDFRLSHVAPIAGSPSLLSLYAQRKCPIPGSLATLLRHTDADKLPAMMWQGRRFLALHGADDTLVPFGDGGSEAALATLAEEGGADVEVLVQPATGHVYTDEMRARLLQWVGAHVCTPDA
jgi:hypothetical protein